MRDLSGKSFNFFAPIRKKTVVKTIESRPNRSNEDKLGESSKTLQNTSITGRTVPSSTMNKSINIKTSIDQTRDHKPSSSPIKIEKPQTIGNANRPVHGNNQATTHKLTSTNNQASLNKQASAIKQPPANKPNDSKPSPKKVNFSLEKPTTSDKSKKGQPSRVMPQAEIKRNEELLKNITGTKGTSKNVGGVIIEDLVIGTGTVCTANKKVEVHYKGCLKNGKIFDASKKPFRFRVGAGEVIRGWDIGTTCMLKDYLYLMLLSRDLTLTNRNYCRSLGYES